MKQNAKFYILKPIKRQVTKKIFIKIQKEEAVNNNLSKRELIDRNIFTTSEIDKLVKLKVLLPVKYKSRMYFNKENIKKAIGFLSEPPKLF